ncbi:hypothetical protein GGU11DRAFT_824932 [Lentinula aff. detonsa]|nr:hypothetical protein GGU11DRAFT_824932 [Lentinula aff. detonsa]
MWAEEDNKIAREPEMDSVCPIEVDHVRMREMLCAIELTQLLDLPNGVLFARLPSGCIIHSLLCLSFDTGNMSQAVRSKEVGKMKERETEKSTKVKTGKEGWKKEKRLVAESSLRACSSFYSYGVLLSTPGRVIILPVTIFAPPRRTRNLVVGTHSHKSIEEMTRAKSSSIYGLNPVRRMTGLQVASISELSRMATEKYNE